MKTETERHKLLLILLFSFSLLSCGGTGISVVEGGISGTGITLGRITKFGSIYVNDVRFNVDKASFTRDGKPSKGQSEFSLGEYIMIKGSFDSNGTGGTAIDVSFNSILEGEVTQVSSDNVIIEILGQAIETNTLTTLLGFPSLYDLAAGNIIEVSGFKNAEGLINATSLKLIQTNFMIGISENELEGVVGEVNIIDKTFIIGNIIVDYSSAALEGFNEVGIQKGQKVKVKSNSEIIANSLIATKIELQDENQVVANNTNIEIEGIVTRFISPLDFDINGIIVTTNSETKYEKGESADLYLNSVLEVEGKINSLGVLLAEKIEFEDNQFEGDSSDSESEDSPQNDNGDDSNDGNVNEESSRDDTVTEDDDNGSQESSEDGGDDDNGSQESSEDGGGDDNGNQESSEEDDNNEEGGSESENDESLVEENEEESSESTDENESNSEDGDPIEEENEEESSESTDENESYNEDDSSSGEAEELEEDGSSNESSSSEL